jgi:hypothetical protein
LQWLLIKIWEFSTGLRSTSIRGRWRRARRPCSRRCGIAWYRRREACLEARVDFLVRSDGSVLRGGARRPREQAQRGPAGQRGTPRAMREALQRTPWNV